MPSYPSRFGLKGQDVDPRGALARLCILLAPKTSMPRYRLSRADRGRLAPSGSLLANAA
jgi:hypothetical protein